MAEDPRYRRRRPAGALGLFLDGRGLLAAGLGACAVLMLVALAWDTSSVARFNAEARQATGLVTRIVGDEALVAYEVPRGSFAQRIAGYGLAEGDRVRLFYLPDDPAVVARGLRRPMPLSGTFQGIASALGFLALWLGWGRGKDTVRALQTRAWGALETAEVTRIEMGRPGSFGRAAPARLHWKRRDGTFGRSLWHDSRDLAGWSVGDMTDIYVWRNTVCWYGDLGPRPVRRTRIPRVSRSGQEARDN